MADGHIDPVFRGSKRRKIFRKRDDELAEPVVSISSLPTAEDHGSASGLSPLSNVNGRSEHQSNDGQAIDIIRHRRTGVARRIGVGFSSTPSQRIEDQTEAEASKVIVPVDNDQAVVEAAGRRFMAPTGQTSVKEDKHMMAYIDSKLADIRSQFTADTQPIFQQTHAAIKAPEPIEAYPSVVARRQAPFSVSSQGQLEEIALPPSQPSATKAPKQARARPPRLGRDGKPLPQRKRYVRSESEVARDALVEQLLSEALPSTHYATPAQSTNTTSGVAPGQDEAADEKAAEEFRKEFLAGLENRNVQKKMPGPSGGAGAGAAGQEQRGPKLGGSRSQRAAMREREEAAKAAKKR